MSSIKKLVVTLLTALKIETKDVDKKQMTIKFHKYQGTGNDFIMIDDLNKTFPADNKELITSFCDRKFGIGSDGILLLQASDIVDFNVDFINPDGSRSFCGNGSRCAIQFAHELGVIQSECQFSAIDGLHDAKIIDKQVELKMSDVKTIDEVKNDFFLDTGSPHHIVFVDDVFELNVFEKGKSIRYNERYRKVGVNVNFVQRQGHKINVRTYERGVEDETLSCGTGVTAAALASVRNMNGIHQISVKTLGGELTVKTTVDGDKFSNIWLCGPAKKVFEGTITI